MNKTLSLIQCFCGRKWAYLSRQEAACVCRPRDLTSESRYESTASYKTAMGNNCSYETKVSLECILHCKLLLRYSIRYKQFEVHSMILYHSKYDMITFKIWSSVIQSDMYFLCLISLHCIYSWWEPEQCDFSFGPSFSFPLTNSDGASVVSAIIFWATTLPLFYPSWQYQHYSKYQLYVSHIFIFKFNFCPDPIIRI